MAYDRRLLFKRVEESLSSRPRTSISEIARQVKVDRHTIERAVRQVTGGSFRQLQQQALLGAALRLLAAEPGRSVKEISFLLGYGSPRAFSRFMRHTCGSPPTPIRLANSPPRCNTDTAASKALRQGS